MAYVCLAALHGCADGVYNELHRRCSHSFHRLADGSESGGRKGGRSHIVEADDGTLFRDFDACARESANAAERSHIIEGHDSGEGPFSPQELFGRTNTSIESGIGLAEIGQFSD